MSVPVVETNRQGRARAALRSTLVGIVINGVLVAVKATAGVLGHSYALVADAVESGSDVISSLVVFFGLKIASQPPSEKHPYGKGRAEAVAAVVVAIALFLAAAGIAIYSVREIETPHHAPEPFTLWVLGAVVFVKEALFRFVFKTGESVTSTAVKADAWHHRSDAITSLAAFIGISIALIGGKGYESADDWAALVAAAVIFLNAYLLVRPALSELTDATPDSAIGQQIRSVAVTVPGVQGTHRCWVRKTGFDYFVELDVLVEGSTTVREGHNIAHNVVDAVRDAMPFVTRVIVHVEPSDEYGRYKLEWER
jgi:cation diffusion facilitator family transporter